jgi:putative transposase
VRRKLAVWARGAYQLSERRATRLIRIDRSSHRYRSRKDPQEPLRRRLKELASTYVRYGYRRLTVLMRREGWRVNAKRIYRVYTEEGLQVRTKQRKRIARRQRLPAPMAARPNQCWAMDFVSDRLADGRAFRIFTAVDQFTRECVALQADRFMSGQKVAEWLTLAITARGTVPDSITADNGSEFAGRILEAWAMQHEVQLSFIRPGRPTENGMIESFNGRLRDECLNVNWFTSLADARKKLSLWREQYNRLRPHSSLSDRTPIEFAALHRSAGEERFALSMMSKATGNPCQGFALPANAALDTGRRSPLTEPIRGRSASTHRSNQRVYTESLESVGGP